MKKNQVSVDGVIYENLADHEIKIKNGEEIITISANKGKKPELKSRYEETLAPIKTYRQFPVRIDNLPAEKEGTIYIVPLFIVTGARELGMRRKDRSWMV